jgi:predicted transcriptional regulator
VSPIHDEQLSMRERQIMDAVYRLECATVAEVRDELPDPPTTNAVRTMLGTLTDKGLLRRERDGRAALYRPALARGRAGRMALKRVLDIFFGGSMGSALSVHLSGSRSRISDEEIAEIQRMLDACRKERRR